MNRRQRGRKNIARERWWISGESEAERKKKDREKDGGSPVNRRQRGRKKITREREEEKRTAREI